MCEENTADSKSSSNRDALLPIIRYCGKLPTYPEALILRGTTYAFQREMGSAISDFSKAIQSNPSVGEAWKQPGQVCCFRRVRDRGSERYSPKYVSEYGSYIPSVYPSEWKGVEPRRTAGDDSEEVAINGVVRSSGRPMVAARR